MFYFSTMMKWICVIELTMNVIYECFPASNFKTSLASYKGLFKWVDFQERPEYSTSNRQNIKPISLKLPFWSVKFWTESW